QSLVVECDSACVSPDPDGESLLVIGAVDQHTCTVLHSAAHALPELVPHHCRQRSHEHPGARLEHPAGELAAEAGRYAFQQNYHHRLCLDTCLVDSAPTLSLIGVPQHP